MCSIINIGVFNLIRKIIKIGEILIFEISGIIKNVIICLLCSGFLSHADILSEWPLQVF